MRGFKNIDATIITAGIGITYGLNPVGNTTPIAQAKIDKAEAKDKYLGSKYDF